MTKTLSRGGWIPASVGCHWSQGDYSISTEDPENWGYAGDLAHYAQTLRDLLATMPKVEELS